MVTSAMLPRCPVCDSRSAAGSTTCETCGYRIAPRDPELELPAELPAGIRIERVASGPSTYRDAEHGELRVHVRSELQPSLLPIAAVMLFATTGLMAWAVLARSSAAIIAMSAGSVALVIFAIVAKMTDRTTLRLGAGRLRVHHGSFTRRKGADVPSDSITGIECEGLARKAGPPMEVRVYALLRGGDRRLLVAALATATQAQFVADLLEVELGLEDPS